MITTTQMKQIEDNSEYFGVSKIKLMENAGKNSANYIKKIMKTKKLNTKDVLVVAGHGNNGGDGFVIARYLNCKVYFVGEKKKLKKEALTNYKKLKKSQFTNKLDFDVIVDCLLGTGVKGKVKEPYASVIRKVNKLNTYKISIDIPSGLNQSGKGFSVKSNLVLTLHDTKPCLTGFKTKIIPIGIPEKAIYGVGPGNLKEIVVERKQNSHKNDYGKILVVASSEEYPGASVLMTKAAVSVVANSLAALRTGADIIEIAAPSNVGWVMHKYLPDLIINKFPCRCFGESHVADVLEMFVGKKVLLVGPGFGRSSDKFLRKLLKKAKARTFVLDADALKAIKIKDVKDCILTPHAKEFKMLTGSKLPTKLEGKNGKIALIRKYAKQNVILLKGNPDIIAYKDKIKLNYTGNPAMTVGGTGDVLAGLCAGFYAQSSLSNLSNEERLFNSACAAAFVNGLAGDKVEKVVGNGLIASDLLKEIGKIIKKLEVSCM
ncbi:NAD(P)H-hydrate dehydratase [Candidatus Woesearchaeota archaeon]|jgi:ADP-dependent NAD(P)H-hydrate dehydratase / NAD(P)H-hydrate epimerase|nr:NAD(P)H-hydrate dehydratase [Candidatus Woesearchaeota archaeon]MBT5272057.1 NAD(P)H-hydrate dehydratase [Candidatus Woesearchaeota archaeon]MBT6041807.1 NAD(P)H-hydrate dehydratase [Candidatus Woesearchaeota archaeon]MBT6336818.1 NAD(P)H-hydrate dehydratase [Candidatus Woesearchaeota archaeon]MBT7927647.1 NAD(P)H-hydrate dehydratase [Candidatus Woesearchaeota archaeon]